MKNHRLMSNARSATPGDKAAFRSTAGMFCQVQLASKSPKATRKLPNSFQRTSRHDSSYRVVEIISFLWQKVIQTTRCCRDQVPKFRRLFLQLIQWSPVRVSISHTIHFRWSPILLASQIQLLDHEWPVRGNEQKPYRYRVWLSTSTGSRRSGSLASGFIPIVLSIVTQLNQMFPAWTTSNLIISCCSLLWKHCVV